MIDPLDFTVGLETLAKPEVTISISSTFPVYLIHGGLFIKIVILKEQKYS